MRGSKCQQDLETSRPTVGMASLGLVFKNPVNQLDTFPTPNRLHRIAYGEIGTESLKVLAARVLGISFIRLKVNYSVSARSTVKEICSKISIQAVVS